jgi:hypothetical protein
MALVHALNKFVDVVFTVTSITTFGEVGALVLHAALGTGQLEGPQKLVDNLELVPASVDLVNDIFHADDTMLAEVLLDDSVGSDRETVSTNLGKTTLVDKLADSLEGRVAIGDVGLDQKEKLLSSRVEPNEGGPGRVP